MSRKPPRVPKYSLHKGTGQAYVTLKGQRRYLGVHGSPESHERYSRIVAQLLASPEAETVRAAGPTPQDCTVAEIVLAFWRHAESYYVKDGEPTRQLPIIQAALRPLRELYGRALATEFGPLALKAVRAKLVESGLCRNEVNRRVRIIKQAFKWAACEELIPITVYQAIVTVVGLRRGRTEAPDHSPVRAVADDVVNATLPHLPQVVADMIRFQRATGARPGEACSIRPGDVDRSDEVWVYRPVSHKTEHFDRPRMIFLGPKAQEVLRPYLLRPDDQHCFSPAESEKRRLAENHAGRKTPMSCGNRPGTNRKPRPKRKPRDRYDKNGYANAVRRAIKKANEKREEKGLDPLPRWTPNMLRHSAATEIRKQFDLEAVQSILGHASMNTSEIYAEKNMALAREIAKKIG